MLRRTIGALQNNREWIYCQFFPPCMPAGAAARMPNMLKSFGKALIALGLNLVALAVLGWVGWDAYQRGLFDQQRFAPVTAKAEPVAVKTAAVNINQVVRAHLFGREQRVSKPVKVTAPPTRLNLKLVGVLASGSDAGGLALIEITRGRQQVVRVGQPIGKTGATLNKVLRDHVLIERNGRLEKLALNRPELKSAPAGKPAAAARANMTAMMAAPAAAPAEVTPAPRQPVKRLAPQPAGAAKAEGEPKMVLPF